MANNHQDDFMSLYLNFVALMNEAYSEGGFEYVE